MSDSSKAPRRSLLAALRRPSRALVALSLVLATGCATYVARARDARDAHDYTKAETYYRQSMTKDKDPMDRELARKELAELLVERGKARAKENPPAAIDIYKEAIDLLPSEEAAKDGLGRLLASLGRTDEAIAVLGGETYGKCDLCERYLAVLLIDRAKGHESQKRFDAALADYSRALQLIPDPSTAFAAARVHIALGDEEAAAKAVEDAVPLIRPDDAQAQATFVKVREEAVVRAAAGGNQALVDRYMTMFPPGSGGDPWYALQLRVANERLRQRDVAGAVAQVAPLLGDDHRQTLPEGRRGEIERFLVNAYTLNGARLLREDKPAEADDAFARASEIVPTDDSLKLLRALAIAGRGETERALMVAKALPAATRGHAEVIGILEGMVVFERLRVGDYDGAKAALERAQASAPEHPEVHVAAAAFLAATPILGISKKDAALLRKSGLARYGDSIHRYGEALSEIAWAREQAKSLGDSYQWRGPGAATRAADLERSIHERYPFEVEFNGQPTTVLTLRSADGRTVEVQVTGPGGLDESVFVSGTGPQPLTVSDAGVITFTYDRRKVVFFAESYTAVTVKLP